MGDPQSRLNGIFQTSSFSAPQGNDALRYTAPKEPAKQSGPPAPSPAPAAAPTASILYSTTVALHQYDSQSRSYVQMGDQGSGNKYIGCVLAGSEVNYTLVFYTTTKAHVCTLRVRPDFPKVTLQPKNFINFYDDKGTNWSVKFAAEDQRTEFLKSLFLVKLHLEIWGPTQEKSLPKSASPGYLKEDLVHVTGNKVNKGDTAGVQFSVWRVVGSASSRPVEFITKYSPFEQTNGGDVRKIRLGDNQERFKALEECVVGMRKGSRRMVLAPPNKTNHKDWYLFDIMLVKTKTGGSEEKAAPPPKRKSKKKSMSNMSMADIPEPSEEIVPVPKEEKSSRQDELDRRELELLRREKQLQVSSNSTPEPPQPQQQAPPQQSYQQNYSPQPLYPSQQTSQSLWTTPGSHPSDVNHQLQEVNGKLDYLMRHVTNSSTTTSYGGPTDVSVIVRGVERLANENERLLHQVQTQNSQYLDLERKCDDYSSQMESLRREKRDKEERMREYLDREMRTGGHVEQLRQEKDHATEQLTRVQQEYQNLLNAYYAKQATESASDQARKDVEYEKQARQRAEEALEEESRLKQEAEQQLTVLQQQFESLSSLRERELESVEEDRKQQEQIQSEMEELERQKSEVETKVRELEQENEVLRSQGGVGDGAEQVVSLFKESVNDLFFQIQEVFEEAEELEGKQVIGVLRKLLKQGTKDVIDKVQGGGNKEEMVEDEPPLPETDAQEEAEEEEDAGEGDEERKEREESKEE